MRRWSGAAGAMWDGAMAVDRSVRTEETMSERLPCSEAIVVVVSQQLLEKVDTVWVDVRSVVRRDEPAPNLPRVAAYTGRNHGDRQRRSVVTGSTTKRTFAEARRCMSADRGGTSSGSAQSRPCPVL